MSEGVGLHEERTRVVCYLPVNDSREYKAMGEVASYLRTLRDEEVIDVQGFLHSSIRPAAFYGSWYSDEKKRWIEEPNGVFTVDYMLRFGSVEIQEKVRELTKVIKEAYESRGSKQEKLWITAYQVFRQD